MSDDHSHPVDEASGETDARGEDGYARRLAERTSREFAREERIGLELAAKIRLGILAVAFAWLAIDLPMTGVAYAYELGVVGVYVLTGIAHLVCARRAIALPYSIYGLFAFDIAFMGVMYSHTNPFIDFPPFPQAILLVIPNFKWFFVFLMQATFALTPRLVIWCGLCILCVRATQTAFIWFQGDFYTEASLALGDWQAWIDAWHDPHFVSLQARIAEAIYTLGMTVGLAAIVHRSRGLVSKRVVTERARANLARYFSPNVVETVSVNRAQVDRVQIANVVVMFVDIKGFTGLCERLKPEEIAELLRDYYRRLTDVVFAHEGTLDKFLGDGVMATFGTPSPRADAPAQALQCGFTVLKDVARWNVRRQADGKEPISVSVGLHYGPALIGNIGDERRLEYAVVGDTVNVSSRVEGLTRTLDADIAVTEECIAAIRQSSRRPEHLLKALSECGDYSVKGRDRPVRIWSAAMG